jgi:hypothetical protein
MMGRLCDNPIVRYMSKMSRNDRNAVWMLYKNNKHRKWKWNTSKIIQKWNTALQRPLYYRYYQPYLLLYLHNQQIFHIWGGWWDANMSDPHFWLFTYFTCLFLLSDIVIPQTVYLYFSLTFVLCSFCSLHTYVTHYLSEANTSQWPSDPIYSNATTPHCVLLT